MNDTAKADHEKAIHLHQRIGKDPGGLSVLGRIHVLKTGVVGLGKNPCLEGEPEAKGATERNASFSVIILLLSRISCWMISQKTHRFL